MKKLFSVLAVGLMLAFGVNAAMACQGSQCWDVEYNSRATFGDYGFVNTKKQAEDYTYNDKASSWANGGGAASNQGYAGGKGWVFNKAEGFESVNSQSTAIADAWDTGKESGASMFAKQESSGEAGGTAYGFGLGYGVAKNQSWAEVRGGAGGFVKAEETGYASGTGALANGGVTATYQGYADDKSCMQGILAWGAGSGVDLTGFAKVGGQAYVSVDPTGNHQSAYGSISNYGKAGVTGADTQTTTVFGGGLVNTSAYSPNSGTYGWAGYQYDASNIGIGAAVHQSYASTWSDCTTNYATAGSSGSAWSFSK